MTISEARWRETIGRFMLELPTLDDPGARANCEFRLSVAKKELCKVRDDLHLRLRDSDEEFSTFVFPHPFLLDDNSSIASTDTGASLSSYSSDDSSNSSDDSNVSNDAEDSDLEVDVYGVRFLPNGEIVEIDPPEGWVPAPAGFLPPIDTASDSDDSEFVDVLRVRILPNGGGVETLEYA